MKALLLCGLGLAASTAVNAAAADDVAQKVIIPKPESGPPQLVSVEDLAALRRIDALSLSPDRQQFAALVRQADAAANVYRRGWFVGSTRGGALTAIGDGGETLLARNPVKKYTGDTFAEPAVQWSPDGQWLAYTLTLNGQTQVWRSKVDGSAQEQVTRNAADVHDLAWSEDGGSIHFTVGTPRAEIVARFEAMERNGYHYDTELFAYTDFMTVRPKLMHPDQVRTLWTVNLANGEERLANDAERTTFERLHSKKTDRRLGSLPAAVGEPLAFAARDDGAQAWSARQHETLRFIYQMRAVLPGSSAPVQCTAAECVGLIDRVWWREDGAVIFKRYDSPWSSLYAWSPATGAVSRVLQLRDDIAHCALATQDRLLCARETADRPSHVATIDLRSGAIRTVADVNPEFRNRRLGKVESFEWDTPSFPWNEPGQRLHGIYPPRAYGYIFYPPDFDPKRKYPVFISPYTIDGFDNSLNREYALHALAARGFVVLLTAFPMPSPDAFVRLGPDLLVKQGYSAELDFPHLSMLGASTFEALDTAAARGFIDVSRVGIGGVSHGSFVPLFMMQRHDRISAISVSGAGWEPMEYYQLAPAGRAAVGGGLRWPKPMGEDGLKYWAQLAVAENVSTIEAPLLLNGSANEMYAAIRLLRHMEEAGKPYDAYVFPRENHVKWQPAHLLAIMRRNVDWFQFWLQSYEDPDPAKTEQYARWRKLRQMWEADRKRTGGDGRSSHLTQPRSAGAGSK